MRRTGLVPALVALVLAASVAGCLGGAGGDEMSEREKELKEQALAAMSGAETYNMTMEMRVEADGREVTLDATGTVDRPARKAHLDMSMDVMGRHVDVQSYVINDTLYQHASNRPMWQRQDVSDENTWSEQDRLRKQRQLLDGATVSIVGHDTIDGHAVTVLRADLDGSSLQDLVAQQGTDLDGASIKDATYELAVDNETNRTRRVSVDMEMKRGGKSATASVTMTMRDYGTDVSIELPEEARDAMAPVGKGIPA